MTMWLSVLLVIICLVFFPSQSFIIMNSQVKEHHICKLYKLQLDFKQREDLMVGEVSSVPSHFVVGGGYGHPNY